MKKFLMFTLSVPTLCLLIFISISACSNAKQSPAQATTAAATPAPTPASESKLEEKLARIAATSGGTVGVSIVQIETGRRAALNGDERFPMASVYKLPIALQLLRRVERGELKLSNTVTLTEHDYRPGISPVIKEAKGKPLTLSIERLLNLMLSESDNSASDLLMKQAGGPEAVTARLRELGISGIDVNRSEGQIALDFHGVSQAPPESVWTLALFDKLAAEVAPAAREAAEAAAPNEPRDSATPEAMVALLIRLHRGETLAPAGTERVLKIMKASPTGPARLKGLLPKGTIVAHKTGTMGATTNDVGIITLPGDKGHLAIAVFVKGSSKSVEERERVIAQIARAAFDYFSSPADDKR